MVPTAQWKLLRERCRPEMDIFRELLRGQTTAPATAAASATRAVVTESLKAGELVRQREEHFDQFVAGVSDYAIFMLDPEGQIATWNLGAERIKGYQAHEIIGK